MHIFITGICGFVGSSLARWFRQQNPSVQVSGMDSLVRPGSETNRPLLKKLGIEVRHGDVRNASDFESLPPADWVIDAAANPSVLAGVDGKSSSRQLVEHNLLGTINSLEYCKRVRAGFALLSTSRVYSISSLAALPLLVENEGFTLDVRQVLPAGVTQEGLSADFSVQPPVSLYGSTKLASEALALEYGGAFDFPVWVNRCGVLAGGGQFGTAEQGIFSFWIRAYARRLPLRYIGFGGKGHQVRDAFHPDDLAALLWKQFHFTGRPPTRVYSVGGGCRNAMSLAQLSAWCAQRFGEHAVSADLAPRPFDLPWMIMDSSEAEKMFDWKITMHLSDILSQIEAHTRGNPTWLEKTGAL